MEKIEEQQPLQVLLVVRWPVGGIRTFMRYVYRRFPVDSFRFVLIAPDHAETRVLLEDLAGLDLTFSPVSANPPPFELVWAVFRQLGPGGFGLVHSHGFTSGTCAALPAALMKVPHVMTSHDVLGAGQFSGTFGGLKRFAMKMAFSLIGTIHSVSHDAQANLLGYFPGLRNRCRVIPNGIETEPFENAEPRNLRQELGVESDVFLVGFLGRFMRQKGFVHVVEAVELLSQENVRRNFLVVALGEGGFVREERAALEQRGLEAYFRFLPFTPHVASVLKGLDLVVMPSLWEACGLLAMETLCCGVPLIASNCIGLREVVRETPAIVVEAGDSVALAKAIRGCFDCDVRQRFVDYVPSAVKRYDVQRTAKAIEKMIREKIS